MDDTEALKCEISPSIVYSAFKSRWETSGNFMDLESFLPHKEADNTAFKALITEKEVEKNIKEMRKNSARVPDGITLGHLFKMHPRYSLLMEVVNLWLVIRTIPAALRECRSILIPKSTNVDRLK